MSASIPSGPVPQVYDIGFDGYRDVTQDDVDRMQTIMQCFGEYRRLLRRLSDRRDQADFEAQCRVLLMQLLADAATDGNRLPMDWGAHLRALREINP